MDRWRELLSRLGLGHETGPTDIARHRGTPDPVEPSEIALLLLKNALRLLDQAVVPVEVKTHLQAAVQELEEYIARRSQDSGDD